MVVAMHVIGLAFGENAGTCQQVRFAEIDKPKPKWCLLTPADGRAILRRLAWVCTGPELAGHLVPYPCPAGSDEQIEIQTAPFSVYFF